MHSLLLLICMLSPTPADVEKARELYRIGGEAYEKGRFPVAISAFEEALRHVEQPAITFSLGQAARLQYFIDGNLAHLRRAIDAYRAYLEHAPTGGRRDHAAQHLGTLVPILERAQLESAERRAARRATVARLIVSSPIDGATASVDGGDPRPIPATFEVTPGERRIEVQAPEHTPATSTMTAVAGAALPVALAPVPFPGQVTVRANVVDRAHLDGQPIDPARLAQPLELPPGRHRITLSARGRVPFAHQFELGRKQVLEVDATLPVTNRRITAWSLIGAGGVSLATGAIFGGLALDAQSDAEALEGRIDAGLSERELSRYRSLETSRDDRAGIALGLGIAGVAALTTGVLLWVFDHEQPPLTPF